MKALKGELEEKTVPEILLESYINKFTGVLRLRKGEIVKNIFFQMGMPSYATSNDKNDRLGAYLTRIGKITRQELNDALEYAAETGKRLGEVLVEQGKLHPEELAEVIIKQVEEIIYSTFDWFNGTYELLPEELMEDEDIIPLQISAANLIMEGLRRRFPLERLQKILGGPKTVLKLTTNPTYKFRELTLKKTEAMIVGAVDGKKTLEEILNSFPDKKDLVYRTLGALVILNTIEIVKRDEGEQFIPSQEEKVVITSKSQTAKVTMDPEKAKKLFELAKEFFRTGKQREALELFKKCVELDPTKAEYYTGLGIALATEFPGHEEEPEEALKIFDIAISLDPSEPRNYYYKGVVLKSLNKIEEARECFLKVLEINPDHGPAKMQLSKL